jgi:hypothetical protein
MELLLKRIQLDPDVTIGYLYVDGQPEFWVAEDPVREVAGGPVAEWKIKGNTAIPYGTYAVQITWSNRFGRLLPLLIGVPGFEGIRIHPGNGPADTEGCLLPGLYRHAKGVGHSRAACDALIPKIDRALKAGDHVTIEIVEDREAAAS